ncbi:MAG: hemerythrin family protein [Anaeromyxobacteraceae bacterium]
METTASRETTWDPALETGHAEIDRQHRSLYACADRLIQAIQRQQGAAAVADAIRFLRGYVREHFEAEEALMREHAYPEREFHVGLHERIRRRLDEVVAVYERDGGSEALLGDVEAMMRGWLSLHIGEKDRALADFLHRQGAR